MQGKKYKVEVFKYNYIKNKIEVPRFQRNLVWSKSNKEDLIKSLKNGLPIGTMLLSKTNNNEVYTLLDGLQRITTIKDFEKNRFSYVNENDISEEDILDIIGASEDSQDIFEKIADPGKKEIKDKIKEILQKRINGMSGKTVEDVGWEITDDLRNEIAILKGIDSRDIKIKSTNIINKIVDFLDLDRLEIPAIIFEGDDNELAYVFEKMNSRGVKLSKYDIFSAQWQNVVVDVSNGRDILDIVSSKYEKSMEESGLEMYGFDVSELQEKGEINLFEYAYAMSKIIIQEGGSLLKNTDVDIVDSIGFTVLAGIFGIKNSKMAQLKDAFKDHQIDYVDLKNKLVLIMKQLKDTLEPWIDIQWSGRKFHASEMQIASYIISLFKLQYSINKTDIIDIKKSNHKEISGFKNYLHIHYLYDAIKGSWAGSGDSKLDEITNFSKDNPCKYEKSVPRDNFLNAINEWLEEENMPTEKVNPSPKAKLFINYLFKGKVSPALGPMRTRQKFDLEHLIPRAELSNYFGKGKVACSTPCNLVVFPEKENRAKQEATLDRYVYEKLTVLKVDREAAESFLYPEKHELQWLESKETMNIDNYEQFLENRKKFLSNEMMNMLFN